MSGGGELGGLLLTGGKSTRMGRDKALIEVDGATLAARTGGLLREVVTFALEVGPGHSSLASIQEEPAGEGPLAAIVAGRRALLEQGLQATAACIVVACDLPMLSAGVLRRLAEAPGSASVLPVIDNIAQPLCARWSANDLDAAATAFQGGERSLRRHPDRARATLLDEATWGVDAGELRDADTPEDLAELGLWPSTPS